MSSAENFVKFVVDQIENAGEINYKKMFGEYAIYSDGKIVALVCDDQLFVKRTDGGKFFIGDVVKALPYPGAKLSFLVTAQAREPIGRIKSDPVKALCSTSNTGYPFFWAVEM